MNYPLISEYIEAIKLAEENFDQLKNLRPVLNDNGKPVMSSGNFAVVFKMKDEQTGKLHAVKCFLKEQEGRAEAYRMIAEELESVNSTFLTPIKYLDKELFVDSKISEETEFPVLLMDWVEGQTLDKYIRNHIGNQFELSFLAYQFSQLAMWLMPQPFAHGDLKPDNILVKNDGTLVLVDYDGMYVPAMKGQKARELGSPDFCHPDRTEDDFDEHIDDFSLASILLSLKAISIQPELLEQYGASDRLLFSQNDYKDLCKCCLLKELYPSEDSELNVLLSLFTIALTRKNLVYESFQLFNLPETSEMIDEEMEEWLNEMDIDKAQSQYEDQYQEWIVECLAQSIKEKVWPLLTFAQQHGKMQVGEFVNKETGSTFKSCIFTQPDGTRTFVAFSSKLGELTPEEIASQKNELYVVQLESGNYSLCKIDCKNGDVDKNQQEVLFTEVTDDDLANAWVDKYGVMYSRDRKRLLKVPKTIEQYSIDEGTKVICNYAFYECEQLTSINIPDGVIEIGISVFQDCRSIQSVIIPNSVTRIGKSAFYGCSSLQNIILPDELASIEEYTFMYCRSLLNINLPESLKAINTYAFMGCDSILILRIPDKVTTIGFGAFHECSSLRSIVIPDSVISIGSMGEIDPKWIFVSPNSIDRFKPMLDSELQQCITPYTNEIDMYGAKYSEDGKTLLRGPKSFWVKDFPIRKGTLVIGDYAFDGSELDSITIPKTVTSINKYSFSECYFLKKIVIPDSVTTIGDYAFESCKNLTSIIVSDSVTHIGDYAFESCKNLTSIIVSDSVTHIGEGLFCGCESLIDIIIPNSVLSIGSHAFFGCKSLQSITIPSSVREMYGNPFCGYNGVIISNSRYFTVCNDNLYDSEIKILISYLNKEKKFSLPDSVKLIGNGAFSHCKWLLSVFIPSSVSSIGESAFASCSYLQSILIPNSIKSIGNRAFFGCNSLQSVSIPNSLKVIGDELFSYCVSLREINIPESVNSIGTNAFAYCSSLQEITIPNSIISIGVSAFKDCSSLQNCIISKSINSLEDETFRNCTSLEHIFLPDSINSIGKYAFENCSSLQDITLPDSIISIGVSAFENCSSLQNCIISKSINSIEKETFRNCTSLEHIFLPDSINSIGVKAFENCKELKSLSYSHSINFIGRFAFDGCTTLQVIEIHLSEPCKQSTSEISSSLCLTRNNPICDGAFRDCTSLKYIDIPNSITLIEEYAFAGCRLLKSIVIPDSVISIGDYAFRYCTHLENVILPKKLKIIPNCIFEYCNSLKTISIPDSVVNIGPTVLSFMNTIYVSQSSYERIKSLLPYYCQDKLEIKENNEG